jgi:hypothetical protein
MIKPQAQPELFVPFLNSNFLRQSRGQQNKGIMSDRETPRQVEYRYGDPPLKTYLRPASRIFIKLETYC